MIRWMLGCLLAVWMVGAAASPAAAQTCTGTLSLLNFGSVDLTTGGGYPTSASLTINCSGTSGQQIAACSAAGADGPYTMSGLSFRLFTDSGGSTPFGFATSFSIGSGGSGSSDPITVYARLATGQQGLPPATYVAAGQTFVFNYAANAVCTAGGAATIVVTAQATYPTSCKLDLPATMNFGDLPGLSSIADATTTISAKCSATSPYNITLDGGLSAASDMTQRKMSFAGRQITYGLYRDASRSQPWGTTIGGNTVSGTGTGGTQSVTVYGRIPPQPTPPPGLYQDQITVTITN